MGKHQVVGVIAMDLSPHVGCTDQTNVVETLLGLRCAGNTDEVAAVAREIAWLPAADNTVVSATLEADLDQLQADLESELASFFKQVIVV
jgi:hypothetical protein